MEIIIAALSGSRPRPRLLAGWLLGVAALVAIMVVLGGLTRLTGSGLSMVQWNPHHLLPPLTDAQWQQAFDLYRDSPQYRLINAGMDLDGYRDIFWLEYGHRLWGRLIGLAFALPLAFFALRGMVPPGWGKRLCALLLLGGLQGVMGWLMVQSGLIDDPDVSPYRLAAHLLLAFAILAALLVSALALSDAPVRRHVLAARVLRGLAALAVLTMVWGALVAGFEAGRIHTSFPLMQDGWLPSPPLSLALTDPASVQYVHRVLAVTTWAGLSLFSLWAWLNRAPWPLRLLGPWAWVQAGLGIATLVNGVPIALGTLHQGGATVMVGLLTWALFSLRR